jgi:23S rRNA (cytidine1920-2'-O)/16S rRNA (cytidine1409-2'-O)-methyltransferase
MTRPQTHIPCGQRSDVAHMVSSVRKRRRDGSRYRSSDRMTKQRLDTLLAERGLFASRSRAAASVMAGEVCVGEGRRRVHKPGEMVDVDSMISVDERPRFVSRGGIKLANALASSGVPVLGRRALDVGASTGGFTDALLSAGALSVIALDVGYGELAWSLRTDPRVSVIERTNARSLTPEQLPYEPDLAVIDVSFISVGKILPAVLGCMTSAHDVLAMIKPQFEVGRDRLGKGGVVRSAADRRDALVDVAITAMGLGESVLGFHSSGLPGPKGNRETFIWFAEAGRPGAATEESQVREIALEVEP